MEVVIVILIFIGIIFLSFYLRKKRKEKLLEKYKDPQLVERLMNKEIWQGQTKGQLIDSIGHPKKSDEKVLKTKTKETWKYQEIAKNRYALKVFLENEIVTGWDKK